MKTSYARKLSIFITCIALVLASAAVAFAGNFTQLQRAITDTPAGGTLTLSQDYTYDASADAALGTGGITLNKAITIDGAGHFVDADYKTRAFKVDGVTGDSKVAIKNLTIKQGGAIEDKNAGTTSGGGVHIGVACNVDFTNCVITKCGSVNGTHTKDGGAALFIYSKAKVNFMDCEISENLGADRAGGVYLRGNATFTNCKIINNTSGSRGGGVYVDPGYGATERGGEWGGNVKMYNCTIFGNKGGRGGGIYVNPENTTLNVFENCTISSNDVSSNRVGNGGGILFYNAAGKLVNCTITDNKAKNGAGVILDVLSTLDVTNCTIANNQATVFGGGLCAHDGSYEADGMRTVGTAKVFGSIITGNTLLSGDVSIPQDIIANYSTHGTGGWADWDDRYEGKFISTGYNVLGTVILSNDRTEEKAPITILDTDVVDIAMADVLTCENGAPKLADNGGKVPTVAIIESGKAHNFIPAGAVETPETDARGIARPQGDGSDAGAFEIEHKSSSSGCNAGFAALLLLAAVPFAFRKKG